jgi:hypothetical protein
MIRKKWEERSGSFIGGERSVMVTKFSVLVTVR